LKLFTVTKPDIIPVPVKIYLEEVTSTLRTARWFRQSFP